MGRKLEPATWRPFHNSSIRDLGMLGLSEVYSPVQAAIVPLTPGRLHMKTYDNEAAFWLETFRAARCAAQIGKSGP